MTEYAHVPPDWRDHVAQDVTLQIAVNKAGLARLRDAASEVQYIYRHVAGVFEMIHEGLSTGDLDNRINHVIAVCEMCRIALDHKAETDGELLDCLSRSLETFILNQENGPPAPAEGGEK